MPKRKQPKGERIEFPDRTRGRGIVLRAMGPAGEEIARSWDIQKLDSLRHIYGIADGPEQYLNLALALARDLYPARKTKGRRKKWNIWLQAILILQVERLCPPDATNKGVAWATKKLSKHPRWLEFLESQEGSASPSEALRRVYYKSIDDDLIRKEKERLSQLSDTQLNELWHLLVTNWR